MTGSLQIKNGKFYMVLNTQKNGKRKLKWLPTGLPVKGNKRKAEQMLRETLLTYELPKADIPFADYITGQWLPYVRRKVDEVTYQGYELLAVRQVAPWFRERDTQLADVTLQLLQEYVDEKAASGRKDGKGGLSPRSLRLHKNVLFQTLTEAVKAGLLPANPCQYVILPKNVRYESRFYTVEQLTQLFEAVRDEPLYPLLKITACLAESIRRMRISSNGRMDVHIPRTILQASFPPCWKSMACPISASTSCVTAAPVCSSTQALPSKTCRSGWAMQTSR